MSLTNEDLFAISQLLDVKLDARLKPIENDIRDMKGEIIALKNDTQSVKGEVHRIKLCHENIILPRLNTIKSCYTSTYNRYKEYADRMDEAFLDIDLLKKVAADHSEKFQKLA